MTDQIVHKTRTQAVLEVLREKILSGDIKGGEPLRQTALAEQLNVSRIPIREALLQLEAQDLVKFEPHKGAVVTRLSVEQADELFELRAHIESVVLGHAIDNMTQSALNEAEALLDELDQALTSEETSDLWSKLNQAFHDALYQPSGRTQSLELIDTLNCNSERYIRLQLLLTGGQGRTQAGKEHRELLELCKQRNKQAAMDLVKQHILNAGAMIGDLIRHQNL